MGLHQFVAIEAMKATKLLGAEDNFLVQLGIDTPVPRVDGAIDAVAQEPFTARTLKRLMDLVVVFTIGDFPDDLACSSYYVPDSPWYNVFYGAYGIRSHKQDGAAWGYDKSGKPLFDEITQIPFIDYNFLTAGELGCPPDKMCFRIDKQAPGKHGRWDTVDAYATIPSGLHHPRDAVDPNLEYYMVFGLPDDSLLDGGRQSYEPVKMHGTMLFRQVQPQVTLVWGGMCPDTPEGNALLAKIIAAMSPRYP